MTQKTKKHKIRSTTPTGASTNPKNFDINKNVNIIRTHTILDLRRHNLK